MGVILSAWRLAWYRRGYYSCEYNDLSAFTPVTQRLSVHPTLVIMDNNSVPFESQVGGHPGLRTSADGSQIIKPCLHSERLFYETVINGHQEGFRLLSKHVPNFLGVTADAEGKDECPFHFV